MATATRGATQLDIVL